MLFETHPIELKTLTDRVGTGAIQLPDFQRPWVWDDERIVALLATVARGFPLGVMMTLETGGSGIRFKPRPIEGAVLTAPMEPTELVMDGQQRLTSLFLALASGKPVQTIDTRRKKLERWYYIDINRSLAEHGDMEDAIRSVPADRKLPVTDELGKHRVIDLTTRENEVAAAMFPLRLVWSRDRGPWRRAYEGKNAEQWDAFDEQVLKVIDAYKVPVIRLTKDTPKEAVCTVFENVNTRGVSLTVFELLTASYAADDFHLPTDWAEVKERLGKHDVLTGFDDTDFLRAITLVSTHFARRGKQSSDPYTQPAASCKRSDILGLELTEYRAWGPSVEEALTWSARFLRRQGIFGRQEVPYVSQLSSLAAIRAVLGGEADNVAAEEKIIRWFWCGVLGEQYSGALDSRLPRDLEQVVAWVGGGREPTSVTEASFSAARLDTMTTRNSAAYKGVCGLLLKQQCIDWTYSRDPINEIIYWEMQVDICQVFPKGWFGRDKEKNASLDSIVNKTLLTSRTSRIMGSRHPSDYLGRLESETALPPNWFDDVIATHLIDPKALREEDFEAFYAARSTALLRLIQDAMGRQPLPPGDAPETLADYEPEPVP